MNSEMIERVAMAIAGWSHNDYEADAEAWNEMVRQAITAMREPTDAMLKAGWGALNADACWCRMIDVALREGLE